MKRKLFLMNMFLSVPLLSGTVFNVISCKKTLKSVKVSDETTEAVIKEKTDLIKQKIRIILDDYTTNFNNKDNKEWVIDLQEIRYPEDKIKVLKEAVKNMKESEEGKLVSEIDSLLNGIVKEKIKQISQYVTDKIKLDNTLDLPNDFKVEINDNFEPMLTNFTSIKFVEAIKKLLGINLTDNSSNQINSRNETYQKFLDNDNSKNQPDNVEELPEPDIFKINATFSYTFNYAGINETDEYKNVQLLATNDISDKDYLVKYGNQQIEKIFNELIEKRVLIYDGNVNNANISGLNQKNLNTKFNWDFNSVEVQNEIINIQVQKIRSVTNNNPIFESFEFDPEKVKFELIDAMNFSNESIEKPLAGPDNTVNLVCTSTQYNKISPFSVIKRGLLNHLGISERKIGTTGSEEYYFNKNGKDHYWDGGELNKSYVDNLRNHNQIEEFYNEKYGQYLIGYGNLYMPRITFANLILKPLVIKTNITIHKTGFSIMIHNLLIYLEGLVNALQNSGESGKPGYQMVVNDKPHYVIQWKFYDKEWEAIKKEIASTSNRQISFNWIMKNVIYNLRAPNSKHKSVHNILDLQQYWLDNAIPEEAIESFGTTEEILFVESSEKKIEMVNPYINHAGWHFKFGPFIIFLSDSNSWYSYGGFSGGTMSQG